MPDPAGHGLRKPRARVKKKNKSRGARPRLPESLLSGSLLPLSYAGVNRIRFKGSPLPRISVLANSPSWLTRKSA